MRRSFLFACLALTVSIGMAQSMSRPVRIVVPFPAGSTTDAMARVLAERLGKSLGEPVIVENKPGANTIIGADTVAKAPPDGRTILLATDATYTINPLLYAKLPYKKSDLVPVSILAHIPAYVMVRATLPIHSLEELIAYAKANPGKLNYGSLGPGSGPHLSTEAFKRVAGIDMVHIPYKGSPEVAQAMLSGQLDVVIFGATTLLPFVKDGKIRLLASSGRLRSEVLPMVPAYEELGLRGLENNPWLGFFAPAGTSPDKLNALREAISAVVASKDYQDQYVRALALAPASLDPSYFAGVLATDEDRYRNFIRIANVKLD